MKNNDSNDKQINIKTIEGANFQKNSLAEINTDQRDLLKLMNQLNSKFAEISHYWSVEIAKLDKKIF